MKKILITILVVLILLLGGAWAYLLLHGAPKNIGDIRSLFGGSSAVATPTENSNAAPSTDQSATTAQPTESPAVAVGALLTKVTTRAVAGAVIASSSTGSVIRYAEKGTGHIYEVSLANGAETRVSNQTIPHVVGAVWAHSGNRLVFTTEVDGVRSDTLLGTVATGDGGSTLLTTEPLPAVGNIAFSENGDTLFYTEPAAHGNLDAKARNLKTGETATLFTTPFAEATVLWDIWDEKVHYVYTKPALGFTGFLYEETGGTLKKIDEEVNLSALRTDAHTVIINKNSGKGPYSLLLTLDDGMGKFLSIETLSQKCAGDSVTLWCGANNNENSNDFPTSWYQGTVAYADQLWKIDRATAKETLVTDPETVAREQLDVEDMMMAGERLIFKNKRDDSLWLYNPPH